MSDTFNQHTLETTSAIKTILSDEAMGTICDALLRDLNHLCVVAREKGGFTKVHDMTRSEDRSVVTFSTRSKGEFPGTYLGIGLGRGWLGLDFLEDRIISRLRKRFSDSARQKIIHDGEPTDSIMGPVDNHHELYDTSDGVFELDRTYTWFVARRIDR